MPLPQLPEDLTGLNDEELAEIISQFRAFFAEAAQNATTAEAVAELTQARDAIVAGEAEQRRRADAAAELAAQVEQLMAEITPDEGDDGDGDGADGEGDQPAEGGEPNQPAEQPSGQQQPEPVAAAAQPQLSAHDLAAAVAAGVRVAMQSTGDQPAGQPSLADMARYRPPAVAARPQPTGQRATVVAAADVPGFSVGGEISSNDDLVRAFAARMEGLGRVRGAVDGEFVPVASIVASADDSRHIAENGIIDAARVRQVLAETRNPQGALTAASILCAPTMPYYEQIVLAVPDRPIRDALVGFNAARGGIRYMPSPVLSDVASGVTTIAADPGTTTKPCVNVACPTPAEVQVTAVPACIEFDNFNARAWPERVNALLETLAAVQAQVAEQYLLDGIATASTAVTAAKGYGAGRQLLVNVIEAAAGFRSRHRMRPDAPLEVLLPSWARDVMTADLIRAWQDEVSFFALTYDQIDEMFTSKNIRVVYYLDTKTGGGQVFGAQTAGALLPFPNNLFFYIFAPGTFVHVDGGNLDFGLIRDSTLNATNKYRMMSESFENVAKVGHESIEVRATIYPDGTYGPAGTALTYPAP